MSYVVKRGKAYYAVFKNEKGKWTRRKTDAHTKEKAKAIAAEMALAKERVRNGLNGAKKAPLPFDEVAEGYLKAVAKAKRSYDTIKQRVDDHLVPHFGKALVNTISPNDVNEFLTGKQNPEPPEDGGPAPEPLSPQTVAHLRVYLGAIFRYAHEEGMIDSNPAYASKKITVPEAKIRYLDDRYIPAVIAAVHDRWRNLFATAIYSGLRKGELLGLKCEDINIQERKIHVRRSYDQPTKSGRERDVAIAEELVPFLNDQLARCKSRWLFPGTDGGMQTRDANLAKRFRAALRAAKVFESYIFHCKPGAKNETRWGCSHKEEGMVRERRPCPTPACKGRIMRCDGVPLQLAFKNLRSTYGTYLYRKSGGDLRSVSESLGHYDLKITRKHYAAQDHGHMRGQVNKLQFGATLAERSEAGTSVEGGSTVACSTDVPTTLPTSISGTTSGTEVPEVAMEIEARGRGLEPLTSGVTDRSPRFLGGASRAHQGQPSTVYVGPIARPGSGESYSALQDRPPMFQGGENLSVDEVAELLQISRWTVYEMARNGELHSFRSRRHRGGKLFFPKGALMDWLSGQPH